MYDGGEWKGLMGECIDGFDGRAWRVWVVIGGVDKERNELVDIGRWWWNGMGLVSMMSMFGGFSGLG